jgi:glycine dehydrogenase subunit 2
MLVEPTESESRESLDAFIGTLRHLATQAKKPGAAAFFQAAPRLAPRRRLDAKRAARAPVLGWKPPAATKQAAE